MAKIKIPEHYITILERISAMQEAHYEDLRSALGKTDASLDISLIEKQTREHLQSDIANLKDIIQALIGMNAVRVGSEISLEDFAEDIVSALEFRHDFLKDSIEVVLPRLKALLGIHCITLSSHARDIQHEYADVFHTARVLTDLRPLFNSSGAEIDGMMVVHNLEIEYFHGKEYKNMFFALDDADLTKLRKALDRAEAKSATLEQVIKQGKWRYFISK